MNQVLTLVVKLQSMPEQRQLLDDTAKAFADACNYINQNVKASLTNRNSIQAVGYQDVKERFGLTANHMGKLSDQNPTSAQVCQHQDGDWYIHIQVKNDVPKPIKTSKTIGVDFGRLDLAVTSAAESPRMSA